MPHNSSNRVWKKRIWIVRISVRIQCLQYRHIGEKDLPYAMPTKRTCEPEWKMKDSEHVHECQIAAVFAVSVSNIGEKTYSLT